MTVLTIFILRTYKNFEENKSLKSKSYFLKLIENMLILIYLFIVKKVFQLLLL